MMALFKSFRTMCLLLTGFAVIHQAEMPSIKPVEEYKTVIPGQTVTLECRAPGGFPLAGVEWIRRELTKENVFFCSPGEKPNLENQHPSFKNRVELEDGDMTDGNVSVILKNVTSNDTGTYECHVIPKTTRKKRSAFDTDPIKIIHLNVSQTGHTEDEDHGVGRLSAAAAAVIGVVVVVVVRFVGVDGVVGFVMRYIKKWTHRAVCTEPPTEE